MLNEAASTLSKRHLTLGSDSAVVNVAVVGTGQFGVRYVDALRRLSSVRVKWVCCLEADQCRSVAKEYDVPHHTTHLQEVCDDEEVDAVVVVTPEDAHREVAVAALESGKHTIIEKPLATTEEDGLAIADAARRNGRLAMTAYLLRFDYRYAQIKERLPAIGRVGSVHAWRNFDRSIFEYYCRTHSFVENAIHDIDLILWYVGSRVARVHGFTRNTMGLVNPDVNVGILEFENGTIAMLQTTWLYPSQRSDILQWNAGIQVMGEHGVLEASNDQTGFRSNIGGDGVALLDQTAWATIHGEPRGAFSAMLRHYIACIRGEAEYAGPTPEDAVESMRIACRLIEDSERPEKAFPFRK